MAKIEKVKVKNFKSFKKALIPIAPGYTTVVGPNGSGKSNLIDAICFATGTGSMRNLRVTKLKELSNKMSKEPTSEVEIEFRDDGNEKISVAREINKDGTSTFRLNGKRTTKFQIDETLAKMNINPANHNIVMQGEINSFTKLSPIQRREMIDDISGIADYEAKKEESLTELARVEEKIKEAGIIMSEKKGYLSVLEKEKIEAEVYVNLKGEEKKHKAALVRKELNSVEKVYTKAMDSIAKAKVQQEESNKKKAELEKKLKTAQEKLDELNVVIMKESEKRQISVTKEIEQVKAEVTITESKIKDLKEKIEQNLIEEQKTNKEIAEIGHEIKAKEKEIRESAGKEDALLKGIHEKQKDLNDLMRITGKLDKSLGQEYKKLDEISREIEQEKEKLFKTENEINTGNEKIKLKKTTLEARTADSEKFEQYEKEYKDKIKQLDQKVSHLGGQKNRLQTQLDAMYEEEKQDNKRYERVENELFSLKEKYSQLSTRISFIKNITGVSEAAQAVIDARLPGVIGTVVSQCEYGNEHAKAIETAAGPRLYYLITETAEQATEAVKFLKQKKLGKASFIPLDKIRSTDNVSSEKKPGVIGTALSLVKYKPRVSKAVEFVFGDTLIIKDIDAAKKIGIGEARMATLDGDLIEYSALITGGFSKTISQAELKMADEMGKSIKDMEGQRSGILAHLQETRGKIEKTRDEKIRSELELKESEIMFKEWNIRLKEHEERTSKETPGEEKEIKHLEEQVKQHAELKTALEKKLNELIQQRVDLKKPFETGEVKEETEKLDKAQSEVNELKSRLNEVKISRSTVQSEIEKVLIKNQKDLEKKIEKMKKDNEEVQKKIEKLSADRNEFFRQQKEKEQKARELATSMKELYEEQEKIEKQVNSSAEQIGMINRELDRIRDEMTENGFQSAKLETRYMDLKHEWEKYRELDIEKELAKSMKDLNEKLEEVAKQIDNIGSVNMKAIDMYNQYKNEIKTIIEKQGTLEEEKQSILGMIIEIEEKKLKGFMNTFNALNQYFQKYFKELYPEETAKAFLKLSDESDPLESGLLIEASTKSKMTNIDSMSGGEKTLTALAFIFAVMTYNPSPFYILDEVDAALDKENSERVARMIKKFSESLQFISITHNPPVIRYSDQIIGVHKDKDGSSIIELKLRDYADTLQKEQEKEKANSF